MHTRSPTATAARWRRSARGAGLRSLRYLSTSASMAARASPRSRPVSPVDGDGAAFRAACSASAAACLRRSATTASISAPRLAQAFVEPLVQPLLERLFALAQRSSRDARAAVGLAKRLALALYEPPLVLERAQIGVDFGEVLGELRLALRQVLPRAVDDGGVQPEPAGHFERQAAARRSVLNLIGRLEGVGREAEPRRRHAGRRRRVGLQRLVVRGRNHDRAARAEVIDDGDAERAAFERIGAGAELVEQHERRQRERAIHARDVGDVPRERAEVRRDRLLVADVGEDRRNTGSRASAAGTNRPACAISADSPAVFSATVLPPVFGPVISSTRRRRNHQDVDGHRILRRRASRARVPIASRRDRPPGISRGWRAPRSSRRPSVDERRRDAGDRAARSAPSPG